MEVGQESRRGPEVRVELVNAIVYVERVLDLERIAPFGCGQEAAASASVLSAYVYVIWARRRHCVDAPTRGEPA